MARIMGIDFGQKRTGISVTDSLQLIVNGLDTVETKYLMPFLSDYFKKEAVEKIVFGLPVHKDGNFTYLKKDIDGIVNMLTQSYPLMVIDYIDESYTSIESKAIILQSGIKKKKRQNKALVDKISAILILQKYLGHI
jgi:putative holliday junction resolvase